MAYVELIYSGYGCASDVEHRGKWDDTGVHQIHKTENIWKKHTKIQGSHVFDLQ